MGTNSAEDTYYIGWDVGAWHCKKSSNSCDAIVIIDSNASKVVGTPWRDNLRDTINDASSCREWIDKLFELCDINKPKYDDKIVIAIDTPLGYSQEFIKLVGKREYYSNSIEKKQPFNPYLFRQTERHLHNNDSKPLSAVQDMLGSQSTKGIHVLSKYSFKQEKTGIWINERVTAIETYPSACRGALQIISRRNTINYSTRNKDKEDALICALVAFLYDKKKDVLVGPIENIPTCEGWIWYPSDKKGDV
jgi:predicted nuclease with RNAse H fold